MLAKVPVRTRRFENLVQFLNPFWYISPMANPASFWDKRAQQDAVQQVGNEPAYKQKLEATHNYLRPDMTVFEFGCGTGAATVSHAKAAKQILAIDYSPKMIEFAKQRAERKKRGNITFKVDSIETMHLEDESFDVVIGLNVLHLVEDKEKVIAKVHRILKPNGLFITDTPCLLDMAAPIRLVLPFGRMLGMVPTTHAFSKDELVKSMAAADLEVEYSLTPRKGNTVFLVCRKDAEPGVIGVRER